MITDVSILNVLSVSTVDLSLWLCTNVLENAKLPENAINRTISIEEIMALLPSLANKCTFVTQLYCMCVSAKPLSVKRLGAEANEDPLSTVNINAKIDMLYRAVQTLESTRETMISMKSTLQFRSQHSI